MPNAFRFFIGVCLSQILKKVFFQFNQDIFTSFGSGQNCKTNSENRLKVPAHQISCSHGTQLFSLFP